MDVCLIQIKCLLAVKQFVAFLQNFKSHIVHTSRLEGVAEVPDAGGLGGQVFHQLIVLFFGFIGLALEGVYINQINHWLVVARSLFGERFQFPFSPIVIL